MLVTGPGRQLRNMHVSRKPFRETMWKEAGKGDLGQDVTFHVQPSSAAAAALPVPHQDFIELDVQM